jgi:hypothetical protein
MQPGESLRDSQELATGPYPVPSESSPHSPILFLSDLFEHYTLGLSCGPSSGFSAKILHELCTQMCYILSLLI